MNPLEIQKIKVRCYENFISFHLNNPYPEIYELSARKVLSSPNPLALVTSEKAIVINILLNYYWERHVFNSVIKAGQN